MKKINLDNLSTELADLASSSEYEPTPPMITSGSPREQARERERAIARNRAQTLMNKLWQIMTSLYGHAFTQTYGEDVDPNWITVFEGVNGRQMADGLNLCVKYHPEFPPGAARLMSLCTGSYRDKDGFDNYQHRIIEAADAQRKATPKITDQKLIAKRKLAGEAAIAEMRKMLS